MINPLIIAAVETRPGWGRLLISRCPGRTDLDHDLDYDLDAIRRAGASAVVTLVSDEELDELGVAAMGAAVRQRDMEWFHLPIEDYNTPDDEWERRWTESGAQLRALIRGGRTIHLHCRGGCGRAGMTAARLLTELGAEPAEAIARVRGARPCAVETEAQEAAVMAVQPQADIDATLA
ncbi:MAG TPA: phosphatase [Beijerinckiaceae bacterium]|nr:phosphatase [Beijerinckiaceae bacterium]